MGMQKKQQIVAKPWWSGVPRLKRRCHLHPRVLRNGLQTVQLSLHVVPQAPAREFEVQRCTNDPTALSQAPGRPNAAEVHIPLGLVVRAKLRGGAEGLQKGTRIRSS